MINGPMYEKGIHLDDDQSLAGGSQTPDSGEIQLTPEDQAELSGIEMEAGEMVAKMIQFAKELGLVPEAVFTAENDAKIIKMASELAEAHKEEEGADTGAQPSKVAFLQADSQIASSEDLLKASGEKPRNVGTYDPNFPSFGIDAVQKQLGYGHNMYLNSHDQLIHFGQSNNWGVAQIWGLPTVLLTNKNELALHTAPTLLDDAEGDLIKLQAKMHDILIKLGKVEPYQADERDSESRIRMEKARNYRNSIVSENTYSFAPQIEKASRDLMRLVTMISISLNQRTAYICEKAQQGDLRFHAFNVDDIVPDRAHIEREDMLNLRRSLPEWEKVKTVYLIDSSYEFTDEDARAAEEANLPWSKIEVDKSQ